MNSHNGKIINKSIKDSSDLSSMFKTSKYNEYLNRPSSIDPLSGTSNRSSYMRFLKDNHAEDNDKVKDELIKIKMELNKKNSELNSLRIDYQRLEEDNTKNLKVIQHVLNEYGKDISENILKEFGNKENDSNNINNFNEQLNDYFDGPLENEEEQIEKKAQNIENNIKKTNDQTKNSEIKLSLKSYIRLREIFVINSLKKQVLSMKNIIKKKDEEIENYKINIKCAKYSKLEFNYNNNLNSYIKTKKDFENAKRFYSDTFEKLLQEKEEKDKLLYSLNLYKSQVDDFRIKTKNLEDENQELLIKNKALDDRINFISKFQNNNQTSHFTKVTLKQKEDLISTLRSDLQTNIDKYKSEKHRLEKRIFFMDKDYKKLKEILDLKNEEKKEIDKKINDLKEEGKKFISNLQWMLKIEKELFLSEKKQLNDYASSLKKLIEDIKKEHEIKIDIPEFKLILPTSTCMQEINQNKILKELEKKYEETEKNLINLDVQDKNLILSQVDLPKYEALLVNDVSSKVKIIEESQTKFENENMNNFENFKIEPVKGKESLLMLTSLNRNRYVDENLFKNYNVDNKNEIINYEEREKKNTDVNLNTQNNNMNNSVISNSKHRLKNLDKGDKMNMSNLSKNIKNEEENFEKKENLVENLIDINHENQLNRSGIDKLRNLVNKLQGRSIPSNENLEELNKLNSSKLDYKELENTLNDKKEKNENEDGKKKENMQKQLLDNIHNELLNKSSDKLTKSAVIFNEETNMDQKLEEKENIEFEKNNKVNLETKHHDIENKANVNFFDTKVSIKSPISPKKKRSSCLKLTTNYIIKIVESEDQEIDLHTPFYIENKETEKNFPILRKNTKSKSQIFRKESFSKLSELEKIFEEGIKRNSEFEDIMNDQKFKDLFDDM